ARRARGRRVHPLRPLRARDHPQRRVLSVRHDRPRSRGAVAEEASAADPAGPAHAQEALKFAPPRVPAEDRGVPDERPVRIKLDAAATAPPPREPPRWARHKWWFRQLRPILIVFATAVFTYVFVDCHTHKLDDASFQRQTTTEDRTFDASLLQQYMALDHDDY